MIQMEGLNIRTYENKKKDIASESNDAILADLNVVKYAFLSSRLPRTPRSSSRDHISAEEHKNSANLKKNSEIVKCGFSSFPCYRSLFISFWAVTQRPVIVATLKTRTFLQPARAIMHVICPKLEYSGGKRCVICVPETVFKTGQKLNLICATFRCIIFHFET